MIKNNVKIPQIAAVVLESIALLLVFSLIRGQDGIFQLYASSSTGIHVFPLQSIVFVVFRLLLFVTCLLTMLYYKGERRRTVSVIFISVLIICTAVSPYITLLTANITAHADGPEYYAASAALTAAISYCISPFSTIATALYFIACGRYGISKSEEEFDPNNYIQL